MANVKKDQTSFTTGKQITIPGGIVSINKSHELADYYSRNFLFYDPASKIDKSIKPVQNIYNLTAIEVIELADNMIHLWIDLKDNVRKYGIESPDIFNIK